MRMPMGERYGKEEIYVRSRSHDTERESMRCEDDGNDQR